MKRGKLKIFFGYCAGVGKTYSMLKAAQELKTEGVDVIIGYLEPHDRPETIKMADGLEKLPLKEINYKGIVQKEFDVDMAIQRHPQLILVDELAHTNAIGSKNRKRYLDVEELLNNGIDVYTTVNVQHIEGLHDLVDSATSVDVNERIPDEIFDYSDEVVLVDIEPGDLIERIREGKVYNKQRTLFALENFFKEEKLSSLRELYMRRGADRIEKLSNNGELKTKILVLVSPSPSSQKNIRVAARMAEAYHCKFSAMYVETHGSLSDAAATNLKKHTQLVRDMGGDLIVKYGVDVVEIVVDYVKLCGVTNLIVGKTWQSIGKKVGLEEKIIVQLPSVEVLIVPDNQRFNAHKKFSFLSSIFNKNKLAQKYKTANKTLDILNTLAESMLDKSGESEQKKISVILARAFERSCKIITEKSVTETAWEKEDLSFYQGRNEEAVAEWTKKNMKSAGRGTDTLRSAEAIYFPLIDNDNCLGVISFSCKNDKMSVTDKLIYYQLQKHLVLYIRIQTS